MTMQETPLQMAERHVREKAALLKRMQVSLREIIRDGQPDAAREARIQLNDMLDALHRAEERRDRLRDGVERE